MSTLDRLSISGIRSFSPESREIITFQPLTIILGVNGAGKTSLIECLRYITTNEFPPNSNRGKLWVHESKNRNAHTIRAQVKLKFYDTNQEAFAITRSLELITSIGKDRILSTKLRTLDSIIQRPDGTNTNSKCVDIDAVILELLGVPKAVLTNVIFCHQEDSNWPLSEGKVLKEKFDQIFGSIGYVKALKKIKDLRKEYLANEKQLESELCFYAELKDNFEENEKTLKNNEAIILSYKENINQINEELKPIEKETSELLIKEQQFNEIEKAISKLKGQLDERRKLYENLISTIKISFKGSEEDLKKEINDFDSNLKIKQNEKSLAEEKISKMDDELKDYLSRKNDLSLSKGALSLKKETFQKTLCQLDELIHQINTNELISDYDYMEIDQKSKYDEDSIERIKNRIEYEIEKLKKKNLQILSNSKEILEEVDEKLDDIKSIISKLEQSIKMNEDSISVKKNEMISLEYKLTKISSSNSQILSLRNEIISLKKRLQQLENENDIEKISTRILDLETLLEENRTNLISLNEKKDEVQSLNEHFIVINFLKSNLNQEKECLSSIYHDNITVMQEFGINENINFKSFNDELKNRINQMQRKIKASEMQFEDLTEKKRQKENDLSFVESKINDLRMDLRNKEKKIRNVCDSEPFDYLLESTEKELESLRSKKASSLATKHLMKEYCEFFDKDCNCPFCHQQVSKTQSIQIIQELKNKIEDIPNELKVLEKEFESKESLHTLLINLKSDYEQIKDIKEQISKQKIMMTELQYQVNELSEKYTKAKHDIYKEKNNLNRFKLLEADALRYDQGVQKISEFEEEINDVKRKMSKSGHNYNENMDKISIDDLKEQIEEKMNNIKVFENELKKLKIKKDDFYEKSSEMNTLIIRKENEKLELEKEGQNVFSLETRLSMLQNEIDDLDKEISNQKSKKDITESKLESLISEKKKIILQKEKDELSINKIISVFNRYIEELLILQKSIKKFNEENIEQEYNKIESDLEALEKNINIIVTDKEKYRIALSKLYKDISEAEIQKRNLKDNLAAIECLKVIDDLRMRMKEEQMKTGSYDLYSLQKRKQELEKLYQDKLQKIQNLKGRQEPILKQNKEIQLNLKKDKYKNAKNNYCRKLVELTSVSTICKDLDKYYKALDHSVMTYHRRKLEEINRLIYKLWKQAYCANDIDYIKIESDEHEERLASDRRKTFNYRVVRVKNEVKMDMRGRCSAGQKVIACLVIRLALAEIFCVNCGILALDEPTTNLDKENIQSFANAVIDICESHSNHKFQLLIITHDEQFLSCLNESSNEFYYRVELDENGYSKIKRHSIRER